jgi:ABC-type uncharacterized transport system ATPase subunit
MGLSEWADKKIEALSKGMAQKVQFISAVIAGPDLVILDEPFTGLDPVNADVLREAVLDLRRNGSTVIFSTHDMAVAEKMCDFIFMIIRATKSSTARWRRSDTYGRDRCAFVKQRLRSANDRAWRGDGFWAPQTSVNDRTTPTCWRH